MILEAIVEPRLRGCDTAADKEQAATGKGRSDRFRYRTGMGVDQQEKRVDDITGTDHSQNLTALPGTPR